MDKIIVANARKLGQVPAGYTLVYVGRKTTYKPEYGLDFSVLGNPFTTRQHSREQAIALYRQHIGPRDRYGTAEGSALDNLRERLKYGERLALVCWCAPQACHADVLKKRLEAL